MLDKKSEKPEESEQEQVLKHRIDIMMSKEIPDDTAVSVTPASLATDSLAKSQKTAPVLPAKLQISSDSEPVYKPQAPVTKPPIVMALADEHKSVAAAAGASQPASQSTLASDTADIPNSTPFDDSATDKAVDDIVASESDKLLAVDDAIAARKQRASSGPSGGGWKGKLGALLKNKWTWVGLIVLLAIIFAVPTTRYKLLGLVIKKPVDITVTDSKTATPVSNAEVSLAGDSAKTDSDGRAHLSAALGAHNLTIQKQYYVNLSTSYFVGFKTTKATQVKLAASGRQVPISIIDKISGKPLAGVNLKILNTSAKTDKNGKATVVLPANLDIAHYYASLSGYNNNQGAVMVTSSIVPTNTISLLASGNIYFLSNLSGNIDVVKANLDGTGRKTVLAGTGKEDVQTTSLLASRDWRYLLLKSRRDSTQPSLYLIDTSSDKITQFDNGDANFNLVGWYGHSFIYNLTKNTSSYWQSGRQVVKSYDADNLQLNQLDQSQAEGDTTNYNYQSFSNFYILNGLVVYNTQWYAGTSTNIPNTLTASKTDTIRAVQPLGQNKKDYQSWPANTISGIQATLYEPQSIYYATYGNQVSQTTYYKFENQIVSTATDLNQSDFNKSYPTFLLSPSGNQTFWTELRDGKNTLFSGDNNGQSQKQIASLSDYTPYGWFSDTYMLVSKNSSELYVMPASGLTSGQPPLKITDYYKPAQTYNGYGYGYGGL